MYEGLVEQGYTGGYGRVAAFARRWRAQQSGKVGKGAFVPLKFALGDAFQFDWSTEYAWVGGLRRRLEVAHQAVRQPRLLAGGLSQPEPRDAV